MKSLYTILEGILDVDLDVTDEIIKDAVMKWIEANTKSQGVSISAKPNKFGKYVVNATHVVISESATSLTNGQFVWGIIKHGFDCSYVDGITSLEGAPKKVGRDFDCSYTNITSLVGSPQEVKGSFDCTYTKITTLEGAPKIVGKSFYCGDTQITSLKGAPEQVGDIFDCTYTKITTLEGSPKKIGGEFKYTIGNPQLKSTIGTPKGRWRALD